MTAPTWHQVVAAVADHETWSDDEQRQFIHHFTEQVPQQLTIRAAVNKARSLCRLYDCDPATRRWLDRLFGPTIPPEPDIGTIVLFDREWSEFPYAAQRFPRGWHVLAYDGQDGTWAELVALATPGTIRKAADGEDSPMFQADAEPVDTIRIA